LRGHDWRSDNNRFLMVVVVVMVVVPDTPHWDSS